MQRSNSVTTSLERENQPATAPAVPPRPGPQLLTVREAAQVLAVSERTLWSLTKKGHVRCVRIGTRGKRYDPAALAAFIERRPLNPEAA